MKYKKVLFRDKIVNFNEANLHITSSPVLYGLSVYTVFNAKWDEKSKILRIFRLEEHYKRLIESCKIMGFDQYIKDSNFDDFKIAIIQLIEVNKTREDILVRVTVFIDEVLNGLATKEAKNSISAYIIPANPVMPTDGVNVCISSWNRTRDNSIPPRAKVNGNYVNAALMKSEAMTNGYDESIALTANGYISEGTVANIFMVKHETLVTPASNDDILIGITRNSILKIAKQLGIEYYERSIIRTEIYTADELFFSGSSAHVVPILSVDKRQVTNTIGLVTKKLLDRYNDIRSGKIPEFASWLTEVKL